MTEFYVDTNSTDMTTPEALKDAISGVAFIVDRLHINVGTDMAVTVGSGEEVGTIDTVFFGPISVSANNAVNMYFGGSGVILGSGKYISAESDTAGYARVFISGRLFGRSDETVVGTFTYEGILTEDDYNMTLTTDIYDEVLQ